MAAAVLGLDEKTVLISLVGKLERNKEILCGSGTLILTNKSRIVFVTEEGIINKKYNIFHSFSVGAITNARVEKRLFGNALAIDINDEKGARTYRYEGIFQPEVWVTALCDRIRAVETWKETAELLNSKERTKLSEVQSLYSNRHSKEISLEEVSRMVRGLISEKRIEGFIDDEKQEFVHITAYRQKMEIVKYNVAASFNFNANGVLEIKCPFCGGSQELTEKLKTVTCRYCAKNYFILEKILGLL